MLAIHTVNAVFARLSSSLGSKLSEAIIQRGQQVGDYTGGGFSVRL